MIPVRAVTTTSRAAAAPMQVSTKAVLSPLLRHAGLDPDVMLSTVTLNNVTLNLIQGLSPTGLRVRPAMTERARNDGEGSYNANDL